MINNLLLTDLDEYLAYKKLYLRPYSYKTYRLFGDNFRQFISDNKLEKLQTRKVTPAICESYRRYVLNRYKHPTTRNKEILQMKCFFKHFLNAGWERYKLSPAQNIDFVLKQDSELHEPFSLEETELIIDRVLQKKDYYLLLFIYFIYYTFLRTTRETRLLQIKDLRDKTIHISPEHSKNKRSKSPTITKPLEQLIDYLELRKLPSHYYIFGRLGSPSTVACGINTYYRKHAVILKELGLDGQNHTLYSWKHSGNIKAVELGISQRMIQLQNGFLASETLEIYVRRLGAYMSTTIYDKFN